jgi:hypothetical protein
MDFFLRKRYMELKQRGRHLKKKKRGRARFVDLSSSSAKLN